ncbi:MAG: tyrosine-type recombinase/integrase [Anaerolineae bacterium]|jgi:integrase|nr:tyrosine-type recombinase/integrase [Anaerolineae bacterium]
MSNLTLSELSQIFYDSIANPRTRIAYAESINNMMNYVGPARPVGEVTPIELISHVNTYIKRELSPHTVNKHIKTIQTFFNWLVKTQVIKESPAKALKKRKVSTLVPKSKAMPKDDLITILEYTKWLPREDAFIKFVADTACRARGVAGLRIGDIDFETNTATVTEKGDISRTVAFGDATAIALRRWLAVRKAPTDFVFQSGPRRFSPEAAGQMVRRLCIKVGVKPRQTHSLRHAKAWELSDDGVGVGVIATALGDTVDIVVKYYIPRDEVRALESLKQKSIATPEPQKQPDNIIQFPLKRVSS